MKKGSGTKKKLNVSIDSDLWEWIDGYQKRGIIDKSKMVNLAMKRTRAAVNSEGVEAFFEEIEDSTAE